MQTEKSHTEQEILTTELLQQPAKATRTRTTQVLRICSQALTTQVKSSQVKAPFTAISPFFTITSSLQAYIYSPLSSRLVSSRKAKQSKAKQGVTLYPLIQPSKRSSCISRKEPDWPFHFYLILGCFCSGALRGSFRWGFLQLWSPRLWSHGLWVLLSDGHLCW